MLVDLYSNTLPLNVRVWLTISGNELSTVAAVPDIVDDTQ